MILGSIPVKALDCLLQNVQMNPGAHTASYSMPTRVLSFGVKREGREADPSRPSNAEFNNEFSCTTNSR